MRNLFVGVPDRHEGNPGRFNENRFLYRPRERLRKEGRTEDVPLPAVQFQDMDVCLQGARTDIIEDHLYAVSIDARTLKVVKNFTENLGKFQHLPQYEEAIPDYQPQDFQKYYQPALECVKQKITSLITRKKQEANVPSTLQPSMYDLIWNPLFKHFEPLACPTCKHQSYALHFLRTGIRCQNCFKNS